MEAEEAQAERLVVQALKRVRWSQADLQGRRKGAPQKVRLARELRGQTTMPLASIVQRLNMNSRRYLAWLLVRGRKDKHLPTGK
jgi:hypothetical protein